MSTASNHSPNQIITVTRPLAAIIVPILVAAFIMLFLFPNHTGLLFAWPIKPTMSAMMLGGTYLGGAYYFTAVFRAQQWHTVKLGFLPVSSFAGILGIATLLHWDKFTPGHISFILWVFLYLTLPIIIPVIWHLNQRLNPSASPPEIPLSVSFCWSIGSLGAVLVVVSLILLIAPNGLIPTWPWTLSPLTARVMAAMFALSGLVALGVAINKDWSVARIPLQAQAIAVILILIALFRAPAEILWQSWGSWLFVAGLLTVLALIMWGNIQGRRQRVTV